MRRDIDIALLRAFVAVVETGSVTGAAALLNLTQAAVSQQLKRLEELFGTELFERHHKRLVLKPNGERLIAHAHRLIALNDEVWGGDERAGLRGRGAPRRAARHRRPLPAADPQALRQGLAARARGAQMHDHAAAARAAAPGRPRPHADHRAALRRRR